MICGSIVRKELGLSALRSHFMTLNFMAGPRGKHSKYAAFAFTGQ
jgi:hypothetical protein